MKHRKMWRSLGYMRPLSIWAMKLAWDKRRREKLSDGDGVGGGGNVGDDDITDVAVVEKF